MRVKNKEIRNRRKRLEEVLKSAKKAKTLKTPGTLAKSSPLKTITGEVTVEVNAEAPAEPKKPAAKKAPKSDSATKKSSTKAAKAE